MLSQPEFAEVPVPASPSKTINARRIALVVLASALSLGAAPAVSASPSSASEQVISGGVGEGARKQLSEQARGYGLKLVFTLSTGSFISDVPFEITSGGNTVVRDVSKGPWAFVKLAPGSYAIKATYEGLTQTRKVVVPKQGQRQLPFSWPAPARVQEQPK